MIAGLKIFSSLLQRISHNHFNSAGKICRYKSIELGYKLDFEHTHSEFNAVFFITKCTLQHKQKPKVVFIQNRAKGRGQAKYILYIRSNMQEWRKKQSRNCGVRLSEWVRRLGK